MVESLHWKQSSVQLLSAIVSYCQLLSAIVRYCQILSAIVSYCQLLSAIVSYGQLLSAMVSYGQLLSAIVSYWRSFDPRSQSRSFFCDRIRDRRSSFGQRSQDDCDRKIQRSRSQKRDLFGDLCSNQQCYQFFKNL